MGLTGLHNLMVRCGGCLLIVHLDEVVKDDDGLLSCWWCARSADPFGRGDSSRDEI